MRFEATTRRPASSSIVVTAPVRLRRVASGLMIEKVRLAAMAVACSCWLCRKSRRPSRGRAAMQPGSRGLLPAAAVVLLPIATVDTVLRRKRFPRQPRLADTFLVEQEIGRASCRERVWQYG